MRKIEWNEKKPHHQDYFWEFLKKSSKFHILHNLNDLYNCVFPSANKNICKWMKERKIIFLWASGGHKRTIVLLDIALFSSLFVLTRNNSYWFIHNIKWKDTVIANHLKKYCCFLKNEKQHLGQILTLHCKAVLVTSIFIQYSSSLAIFTVGRERQFYTKEQRGKYFFSSFIINIIVVVVLINKKT